MEEQGRQAFMRREIFSMTLGATAQRARLYLPDVPEAKRRKFHEALRARLERLATQYLAAVSEEAHVANIAALADELSAEFGVLFSEGRFRVGLAQKALNLYLKYLWCLGWCEMPPHCPVDAIVLAQVDPHQDARWTQIDSLDVYRAVIEAAKQAARGLPLSVWELNLYNRAVSAA